MLVQCPNDLAAIMVARDVTRTGQAVEVWRDDRLIYHTGLRPTRITQSSVKPKPRPSNRAWLANFLFRNW
jgi:hypothetical protein